MKIYLQRLTFFTSIFFSFAIVGIAQYEIDTEDGTSLIEQMLLYGENDPLSITITTDLRNLVKEKFGDEYQSATLAYTDPDGQEVTYDVQVKPRGNIRREICFYPNLKVKFKKPQIEDNGLVKKYNDLKIVHKCKGGSVFDQYVLKEHLAYKITNLMTQYSYRVKLLQITYKDTGAKKPKDHITYAFFIEDLEELSERFGGQPIKRAKAGSHLFDRTEMLRMCVIQYAIGNPDWAFGNVHNLDIMTAENIAKPVAVPKDWDYSGLVNTTYAIPAPQLPIEEVTERIYRGPTASDEEMEALRLEVLEKQEAIMACVTEFALLDKNVMKSTVRYMEDFFKVAGNPKTWRSEMRMR